MTPLFAIYCADIGSITKGRFGWARRSGVDRQVPPGDETQIEKLVEHVSGDLSNGLKVALGFECPLYVPVPANPARLGRGRLGEGQRAWSAQAGAFSLTPGLCQVPWILREIRSRVPDAHAFLDWQAFRESPDGIFLWEAFVTGEAKAIAGGNQHVADAKLATEDFEQRLPNLTSDLSDPATDAASLIGAALLWSGFSAEPAVVRGPCLVIKAQPEHEA